MYFKRHLQASVLKASKMYPSVLVTGARQVGKTTMLRQELPMHNYVSLDDLQVLKMAKENTSLFFNVYKHPIIIDEIQYEPKLFHYIKMIGDEAKQKSLFFMTGSQSFSLMKNISESLAGRVGILQLLGLSQRELNQLEYNKPFLPTSEHIDSIAPQVKPFDYWQLFDTILKGSFPAVHESEYNAEQRSMFFNDYLRTYIERDIRALTQITDENAFLKFITSVASLTGQQLNISSIARVVGKEPNTIKKWLSVLETCGLIYILQPFSDNILKRLTKMPKLYFLDTGLACHLCGWSNAKQLAHGAQSGAIFETFVISEILKSYTNYAQDTRMSFSYYRDSSGKEIDLIIESNGVLHPIEIKLTASPNSKDIKHFASFNSSAKQTGQGAIICLYDKPLYLDAQNRIIPVNYI